jgi:GTP-binding protein
MASPAPVAPYTDDQIEAGRRLFATPALFLMGAVRTDKLPAADSPEVAFAGRSNVGKSSLINALVNRRQLARASNTPGRTQELNFFDLGEGRIRLVDLPGYGFASAPRATVDAWSRLTMAYLRGRSSLKRVLVLIDSRRGIGPSDHEVMSDLDTAAVAYQIVLTKSDKLSNGEAAEVFERTLSDIKRHPAAHPRVLVTSSEKGSGIDHVRAEIALLASPATGQ